jgi:hypothetical protein
VCAVSASIPRTRTTTTHARQRAVGRSLKSVKQETIQVHRVTTFFAATALTTHTYVPWSHTHYTTDEIETRGSERIESVDEEFPTPLEVAFAGVHHKLMHAR